MMPRWTSVYPYFDNLQVWLRRPIDRAKLKILRRQCRHLRVRNKPTRFLGGYSQRLKFKGPGIGVLRWLASRDDALVNRIEISLDYVFDNWVDRTEAFEFMHHHFVRLWHGRRQQIRIRRASERYKGWERVREIELGQTRYDTARRAPNCVGFCKEKHCRVTGELNNLHVEWRANGLKAVRATGIHRTADLLTFDHYEFWRRRLLLYKVDSERLGRMIRNKAKGTKRTKPEKTTSRRVMPFNDDLRVGETIRIAYETAQQVAARFAPDLRVRRALTRIPNDAWLPNRNAKLTPS